MHKMSQNVGAMYIFLGLSTSIYTDYHHIAYFPTQVSNVWVSTKPVKIDQCEGVPDPGTVYTGTLEQPFVKFAVIHSFAFINCTSLLFFLFFFFAYCFLCWSFLAFALTNDQKFIVTLHFFVQQYHDGYLEKCQQNSDDVGMGRACQALARAYEM